MENIETLSLEIVDLCKSYGDKKVLDNVSFSIKPGEIVGFLGPNGAGKSTTMNIITGYISATSGDVKVMGMNILEHPDEAKKRIGYLPEIPPLYTDMTVHEYLSFVYDLKKCKNNKKVHINKCMKLVKLEQVSNRLIKNLSKGYKQRVGLAQALIGEPDILILDEPTVGLDPAQIMEIRELIRLIGQEKTVILSTHILQEVRAVCDKIVIINQGKIMACDTIKNLENNNGFTYIIKAMCDSDTVKSLLSGLDVTLEFLPSTDETTLKIHSQSDIRADIFNAFSKNEIILLELRDANRSIEDVFREYTSENVFTNNTEKNINKEEK